MPTILLGFTTSVSLYSLPRLAVEHSVACKSCHINPNGGGARTEFGNHSVALNELCIPQTKKLVENRFKKPRVLEDILVGFDSRYLISEATQVFRMQTDAFVTFEPIKDFYYHMRFWEKGINENYVLLYFDQQKYYVKAGRFAPAYGLRMDDHKTYVREILGLGSNLYQDGLSLGAEIRGTNFVGELFNPGGQLIGGVHIFRPGYIRSLSYLAGISVRLVEDERDTIGTFANTKGVFGGVSYDRFTLLGECDIVGKGNDSILVYAGFNTRIEYGLYFIAEYNFFDPDKHLKTGTDEFVRLSIELYPLPFVQLRPSYTFYTKGILDGEHDLFMIFHVGY